MSGEKRILLKKIILVVVIFLPACISFVLLFQVVSLRNEMRGFQNEFNDWCYVDTKEENDNSVVSINEDTSSIPMNDSSENILSAKADELENRQIINNVAGEVDAWDSETGIRKIYLTFDDGPSANTEKILDILDAYGVKATFFVVGKEGYTKEYQRIVEDGHTLAMHSYSHKYQEIYDSVASFEKDLNKIHTFLYETTGVDCKIARFPGGSSNTVSKVNMEDLEEFLSKEGIKYYDWNVSGGDATGTYRSALDISKSVIDGAGLFNNVVVLLHDSSSKISTVDALPMIIEKLLESENTVLLPISDDTIPVQHELTK